MKKIGTYDWSTGICRAIKEVIPSVYTNGVDVYKDEDGSVRIFPHKVSYMKARDLACDFLYNNNATCNDKICYAYYKDNTVCIIFDKDGRAKIGTARLNPSEEDNCNVYIGQALSYSHASGKKLPADLAAYLGIKQ